MPEIRRPTGVGWGGRRFLVRGDIGGSPGSELGFCSKGSPLAPRRRTSPQRRFVNRHRFLITTDQSNLCLLDRLFAQMKYH